MLGTSFFSSMFCHAPLDLLPQCSCSVARRPCLRTARDARRSRAWQPCACSSQDSHQASCSAAVPRRQALLAAAALAAGTACWPGRPATAFSPPPPGSRRHDDKLDGYSFDFPESWIPVTTSGNDVFYRNPYNVEENLFVNISSPSSSKFADVTALGSPEAAADRLLKQTLDEFMSTRLGSRKQAEIVSASRRDADGRAFYDIELRARSYASRNQLAVSQKEIDAGAELEWDRHYLTTLGVANKRLYEFRIQTSQAAFQKAEPTLRRISDSFRVREVEA